LPDILGRLAAKLSELAGAPVELDRPNDPAHGDYATNVAMQLAPVQRRSPKELGEELASAAAGLDEVERAEVAGPGFVNLWLAPAWFGEALAQILAAGNAYGGGSAAKRERVQVEMVSANPTGPITVASARNGAIGDSVARLLEFAGNDVEREYYYNDAGAQMEKFRESVEAIRRGEEPPEDGYRGDYVHELAAQEGDPVPGTVDAH
jgi:arginyl-tRNA synthetase